MRQTCEPGCYSNWFGPLAMKASWRPALVYACLLLLLALPPFCAELAAGVSRETERQAANTLGRLPNRGSKPNIVVFLIDDLGVMDTSVPFLTDEQGQPKSYPLNQFYRTPNLERLAEQGVRFSNFYAMSVCSPTRVSLMTGQTSARHHTTQWIDPAQANSGKFGPPQWNWKGLAANSVTLPRLLQQAGYRTIHCGKGHFGPFDSEGADPTKLGFDRNIGGSAAGQPGSYYGKENFGNNPGPRVRWGVPSLEKYHGQDLFLTEALTLEFNSALAEAVSDDKPFFGYFAHYAVHAPFQPDSRFVGNYPGQKKELAAFASLVEGMDDSIGKVVAQLERLGVAEQTLLVFLGDNGSDSPRGDQNAISCAAPLRGKKGTHYEGGMRAPCLVTWAKPISGHPLQEQWPIQRNVVCSQITAVYDIAPTLLELATGSTAGLPQPIDGRNLWPELAGAKPSSDISFLMHFPHEHRSNYFTVLRRGDWKLVYHWRRGPEQRTELFQLGRDPSESENLMSREPEQLRTMLHAMQQALDEAGAQLPLADDRVTALKIEIPN
jgi:arylsulfatase A-like enzyme